MTHRCAIYLRQSLDATGEQLAVRRQREDCKAIAKARKWQVVHEFIDNSISASDVRKQRPGYDALLRAFDAGEFDALICYDLDRLTRQPRQLEDWIDRADPERGGHLLLVTANGEADLATDAGRMFARVKAAVARSEVDRKSARQRRAAQQRAEQGRPPLGVRLTGYTPSGDVVPEEAELVAAMFSSFAAGESLRGIARQLNDDGIPTRHGARWNPSSVRTILTNPRYAGRAVYRGKVIDSPAGWKPLVSEDLFTVVQGRLSDPRRATNRVGTHRRYLGSGLFLCTCGSTMVSFSNGRYRCAKSACYSRSRAQVDDYVHRVIEARLAQPDLAGLLTPKNDKQHAALTAKVTALRERLDAIAADYDSGLIDGVRFKVATDKAHAELTKVEQGLAAAGGDRAAVGVLLADNPVDAYRDASTMRQREVVDFLCTVTLMPGAKGSRTFDPDSVQIRWKDGGNA